MGVALLTRRTGVVHCELGLSFAAPLSNLERDRREKTRFDHGWDVEGLLRHFGHRGSSLKGVLSCLGMSQVVHSSLLVEAQKRMAVDCLRRYVASKGMHPYSY